MITGQPRISTRWAGQSATATASASSWSANTIAGTGRPPATGSRSKTWLLGRPCREATRLARSRKSSVDLPRRNPAADPIVENAPGRSAVSPAFVNRMPAGGPSTAVVSAALTAGQTCSSTTRSAMVLPAPIRSDETEFSYDLLGEVSVLRLHGRQPRLQPRGIVRQIEVGEGRRVARHGRRQAHPVADAAPRRVA